MSATDIRTEARKDPDQLAREIDTTRASLGETLDALQAKLSPGQLVDEAMGAMRGHGAEFARNLGTQMKNNPLPALLIGAGLLMLLRSNRSSDQRSYESEDMTYDYDEPGVGSGYAETGAYVSGDLDTSGSSGTGRTRRIREKVRRTASSARERVSRAGSALSSAGSSIGHGVSSATGSARAQAVRARDGFSRMMDEQPLVVGAVGVAVGAALGALIPTTERENRVLGEYADKAKQRARELGAQGYEKAREMASKGAEGAKQAVGESMGQGARNGETGGGSPTPPTH